MNTHKILNKWQGHDKYPEIAKNVSQLVHSGDLNSKQDVLNWVDENYALDSYLYPFEEPQPFNIFGSIEHRDNDWLIPYNAIEQMGDVMSTPVALKGALMPDSHYGYAMPIGGVALLDNAISPSFVGYDISCMMYLTVFDISSEAFMENREYFANVLKEETFFGKGVTNRKDRNHAVMDDSRWNSTRFIRSLKQLAQTQIGTSGGGNHFADLMIYNGGHMALLTHSGSRGAGHKFATEYVKQAKQQTSQYARGIRSGYEWLMLDSEKGQEYLEGMELLGDYALANHELIHYHFALETGLTSNISFWNRHNFAWIENDGILHRKGATPADIGDIGIIPGSSGSNSYVVEGLGNEDSLCSSSHGAGRPHSRTQAKELHDEEMFQNIMVDQDILHSGLAKDETVQAYKDIDQVMEHQEGILVNTIGVLEPKVVIMGGQ